MTIDITISLSDEDLGKFQQFVDRGKQAVLDPESAEAVEAAADDLIQKARRQELSKFVAGRFEKLEVLLNMIRDGEWQLAEAETNAIRGALYYFIDQYLGSK